MDKFANLDLQRRLTPWNDKEHCAYVTGKYGSLFTDKDAAEAYIQDYEKKEVEADLAYEGQRTLLRQASVGEGETPQELPDLVKIDWNPRGLFAKKEKPVKVEVKEKEVETHEEVKVEVAEKKKSGRKPKVS